MGVVAANLLGWQVKGVAGGKLLFSNQNERITDEGNPAGSDGVVCLRSAGYFTMVRQEYDAGSRSVAKSNIPIYQGAKSVQPSDSDLSPRQR